MNLVSALVERDATNIAEIGAEFWPLGMDGLGKPIGIDIVSGAVKQLFEEDNPDLGRSLASTMSELQVRLIYSLTIAPVSHSHAGNTQVMLRGQSSPTEGDDSERDVFAMLRWACAVDPAGVASVVEDGPEQPALTDAQTPPGRPMSYVLLSARGRPDNPRVDRVYPPVPPPIGSRPGYILPSLLRLLPDVEDCPFTTCEAEEKSRFALEFRSSE
eukprot:9232183-Pyramimonas_sp.AAC.1